MAFLRVMVVDSLSLPPTPKLPPVIDSILDAQPELSTPAQQNRFAFRSSWKQYCGSMTFWNGSGSAGPAIFDQDANKKIIYKKVFLLFSSFFKDKKS
jgi:hypothetical protein